MDRLERELLQEELSIKRRLHQHLTLKAAQMGISVDPSTLIQKEDLEQEIRTIQRALDLPLTSTLQKRSAPKPVVSRRTYSQSDIAHLWIILMGRFKLCQLI